jgi:glycolate oxidase FAD binding subunit
VVTTPVAAWSELDAQGRRALAVDGLEPRWRARPASPAELAETLRRAAEQDLVVAPRGGGTQLGLGNPPPQLDLVVETTALRGIVEYEPADLTVTVQAGMPFADLQAALAEHAQFLALDPPAAPGTTIGGIVATNASGPLRFAYGTARDLVLGTRVANAEGQVTRAGGRVVKNVAGYDLNKLYVGSLGTLGVITELSFKLTPIPAAYDLVAAQFGSEAQAGEFLHAVIRSPLSPLAVELLWPSAAARVGWPGELTAALRVGGYPEAVARQRRDLRALAGEHGGAVVELEPEAGEASWAALRDLALGGGPGAVLVKAAAPVAESARLVGLLARAFAGYEPAVWAHAGSGVAYALFDTAEHEDLLALRTTLEQARSEVRALDGNASLVVERCPAPLKRGFDVWGEVGPSLPLMQALKSQLDPKHTLNRGRYVGGI